MRVFLLVFSCCFWMNLHAQLSPFEKSNGMASADYAQVISWYKNLDQSSPGLLMKKMGPTDAYYPLNLVLISRDGDLDPVSWRKKGKTIILLNNGIHPGEPDGIDASMMLARDIIKGKVLLPVNIGLAIIPVYNIGGCLNRNAYTRANQNGPLEYGFRGNSKNLDLNRDFTKADSRNAQSFTEIFHYLDPQVLVDNHVSDGADYQHTMTLITTQYDKFGGSIGPWLRQIFEPALYSSMQQKKWDLIPYVDFGSSVFDKGINMFFDNPRYSSGYAALFQTLAFMPETHMLKPYKERVSSTYDLMVSFINETSKSSKIINRMREQDRQALKTQKEFVLSWKLDTSNHAQFPFKGYEQAFKLSPATGLQKMYYDRTRPYTRNIPFYNSYQPEKKIIAPRVYIVPHGYEKVIALLKANGVQMRQVMQDSTVTATVYHIDNYKTLPRPYEMHHMNYDVKLHAQEETTKLLKGDYLIQVNQVTNRFIVEMLEPEGADSYFAWNFFDGILQQKEGYSAYRWEDLAAIVLEKDPALKLRIEAEKARDTAFRNNSGEILDFIYRNSPYFESAYLRYPVLRLD